MKAVRRYPFHPLLGVRALLTAALFVTTSLAPTASIAAESAPDAHTQAVLWLKAYGTAWETRDAELAGSLFSESARYYETPFSEPYSGSAGIKEYWARVTTAQSDIEFTFEVLAADATHAWAHWTAEFKVTPTGERVSLDGMFQLTFDQDFRCSELREWWHVQSLPATVPAGAK